ncbi:glycerophosphodiester phosphodiesterase family protein [Paenibacillus provencensis]|uniref:Glycerophosphodiester phosphodiesterase family protein n=1 Tax=Paenibacillus provencensis TaxID=441151 RepID=A0ABW3Q4B3_9BACL|nr:glycerophosphodiester phosphodiesterase family protein [Paenibacillus sp. MER 78]MCM3128529.1 glycerophosphodiester phosphodiesterase [Paenibacillus sp. MER 78]
MIEQLESITGMVVAGHRGYKSAYPENTLLSFKRAIEVGCHMLEFDLRMSKDREVVVIHDATVDRTTNGSGEVREKTLAELKELDAGGWFAPEFEGLRIPAFQELCQLLAGYPDMLLNVEIKSSADAKDTADAAIELLHEHGLYERCVFTCFDADIIAYLYDQYGAKTQGFKGEVMRNFVPGEDGTYSKMWALAMELAILNREDVQAFRNMGLQVWSYCPDTSDSVLYAVGCGTQMMTCNDPLPALRIKQRLEGTA